jgi:hypothetical protein
VNVQAMTNKTPIEIATNDDGEPEVPSITQDNGIQTKVVQATLRKYCTTHICES